MYKMWLVLSVRHMQMRATSCITSGPDFFQAHSSFMYIRVSYRIFFPGGVCMYVDAFKGCLCASAYPLGFCKVLDIFKDKNHWIQL